jgi:hypothetical protein
MKPSLVMQLIVLATPLLGCSAGTKSALRTADSIVRDACEALAAVSAEQAGVEADKLIATSCAIESVTRRMRDRLLAQQLGAARDAGLAVNVVYTPLDPEPDFGLGLGGEPAPSAPAE